MGGALADQAPHLSRKAAGEGARGGRASRRPGGPARRAHRLRLFFEQVAVFVLIAEHLLLIAAADVGDGAAARRLGVPAEPPAARPPRLLCRRLEGEIDALYERIGAALRAENERLREEIGRLCEENEILRRAAGGQSRSDEEGKG